MEGQQVVPIKKKSSVQALAGCIPKKNISATAITFNNNDSTYSDSNNNNKDHQEPALKKRKRDEIGDKFGNELIQRPFYGFQQEPNAAPAIVMSTPPNSNSNENNNQRSTMMIGLDQGKDDANPISQPTADDNNHDNHNGGVDNSSSNHMEGGIFDNASEEDETGEGADRSNKNPIGDVNNDNDDEGEEEDDYMQDNFVNEQERSYKRYNRDNSYYDDNDGGYGNGDIGDYDFDEQDLDIKEIDETKFLTSYPFSKEEFDNVSKEIVNALEKPLQILEEHGHHAFIKFLKDREEQKQNSQKAAVQKEVRNVEDATIQGSPRDYQRALFEIAKKKNTIINLGTGFGKTLIALLCIRDAAAAFEQGKQTLFMVPSVALAVQQSGTLRANLPYTVESACYARSNSDTSRQALARANIIVATHGAIQDLLTHYGDMFNMSRFNLLVIDECHYATGNHAYALVMRKFYHKTPEEERPRVLGLTASPLVNVRESHTDEQLSKMLAKLEQTLDSTLASVGTLSLDNDMTNLLHKTAKEKDIFYERNKPTRPLPTPLDLPVHKTRQRELKQLEHLYQDLGPFVLGLYCRTVAKELSRNSYENETAEQYECTVNYLLRVALFCQQECESCLYGGRSEKLLALEELLEDQIEKETRSDIVGLIFVERRVTAMALQNYFLHRDREIENGRWIRASAWKAKAAAQTRNSLFTKCHTHKKEASGTDGEDGGGQFDDEGRFDDADELDMCEANDDTTKNQEGNHDVKVSPEDQFMDADESDSDLFECSSSSDGSVQPNQEVSRLNGIDLANDGTAKRTSKVRTEVLVRNATQIFKSLHAARKITKQEKEDYEKNWLHKETKIKEVLNRLRRGEINILIATSVVEEGVDVQACSFVAVFDTLKNTKGYIQMKGRARQKNAKFFVFQAYGNKAKKSALSLSTAQEMERRVHRFIECEARRAISLDDDPEEAQIDEEEIESVPLEIGVLKTGTFSAENGTVDLHSAKSLINRYTLSVPLDPYARSSRESLLAHMAVYDPYQLILPSHLPRNVRIVSLPREFRKLSRKERHKLMALIGCVRLHRLGLLNDRLLPLAKRDMQSYILRIATKAMKKYTVEPLVVENIFSPKNDITIYVYQIHQTCPTFTRCSKIFQGEGHSLALITFQPIGIPIPDRKLKHGEFGVVFNSLGTEVEMICTKEQQKILSDTYLLLINERWRRRSRNMYFRLRNKNEYKGIISPYLVGILDRNGRFDWEFMIRLLQESNRSKTERQEPVLNASKEKPLPKPRLWSPLYDENVLYIAYGPSNETCSAKFPHEKEGVESYADYFRTHRHYVVPDDSLLFHVQRLWNLPSNFPVHFDGDEVIKPAQKSNQKDFDHVLCEELSSVKLAQVACVEPPLANVHIALLCCMLPQFLFAFERYMAAKAFVEHCEKNFPVLFDCVSKMPFDKLMTALTAQSCSLGDSYDKLEWFGDAVLKLVQTDVLLRSIELRNLIAFLHEGDLSTLRSAMGCNDRLEKTCKHLGFDKFVMTAPLARGKWLPSCLDFVDRADRINQQALAGKVCADVIEALLGLIYLEHGYFVSLKVSEELQVTIAWDDKIERQKGFVCKKQRVLDAIKSSTGYDNFKYPELAEEAFTHPSALHPPVPSYQRLEWVGDAVLCLAAREWIFKNFQHIELGDMVVMEAALVANETLAFLSIRNGLQQLLDHRDQSLPARIESYDWNVRELGRGLWGADPPKAISDIVEAILGAVHTDGGFQAGQDATLQILSPITSVIKSAYAENRELFMKHPKKIMQEMGGELLQLSALSENEFALSKPDIPVWFGEHWGTADRDERTAVSSISCIGQNIFSVSDETINIARNRACAFVVTTLERNPELLARIKVCRVNVESGLSLAASGKKSEWDKLEAGLQNNDDDDDDEENGADHVGDGY